MELGSEGFKSGVGVKVVRGVGVEAVGVGVEGVWAEWGSERSKRLGSGCGSKIGFWKLGLGGVVELGSGELGLGKLGSGKLESGRIGVERVRIRGVDDVSNFIDPNSPDSNFPNPIPRP